MTDENNSLTGSETPETAPLEKPADASPETEAKTETGEQPAEGSEPEKTEQKEDAKEEERPKPKSRAQERIESLARDKRNLQRTVGRLNQEIGRLRAEQPPKEEDFADPGEYQRASFKRATRESALESQFEGVRSEMEQLKTARQDAWAERIAEARERMPDFEQIFDGNVPISEVMADLIVESETGPEVAYYLGKNRHIAARIAALPPVEAAREMGRLEARLTLPKPKQVSSTPKPPQTVAGKPHQALPPLEQETDYERFRARLLGAKS
jgi:hypothetical protein